MDAQNANARMVTKLMFRLLPVQALLVAVDSLDGFVSSFFANNYVGVEAMSAVGLYSPINTFIGALSLMLSGGTSIVCGKYLGRNQNDKLQDVFSLNVLLTSGLSFILALVFIFMSLSNLTTVFCDDEAIRPLFNAYLIGQALGFLPNIMTNQLPVFLAFENRDDRTLISSIAYVLSSIAFNFVFVQAMRMEALGLALATTVGNWIFFAVQAQYFFTKKAHLRFSFTKPEVKEVKEIVKTGLPGASTNIYQTIRGFIVNHLIVVFRIIPQAKMFLSRQYHDFPVFHKKRKIRSQSFSSHIGGNYDYTLTFLLRKTGRDRCDAAFGNSRNINHSLLPLPLDFLPELLPALSVF